MFLATPLHSDGRGMTPHAASLSQQHITLSHLPVVGSMVPHLLIGSVCSRIPSIQAAALFRPSSAHVSVPSDCLHPTAPPPYSCGRPQGSASADGRSLTPRTAAFSFHRPASSRARAPPPPRLRSSSDPAPAPPPAASACSAASSRALPARRPQPQPPPQGPGRPLRVPVERG